MAVVLYEGPSLLDGKSPIVALATGVDRPSKNRKTGPMIQTWILRADMSPVDAVRSGQDDAVCGDCVHRGTGFADRSCYVNVGQAPQTVFKAARARYTAGMFAGHTVRLGAYGDPAAVPFLVWQTVLTGAAGWTGYTQQWRHCDPRMRAYCMASVASLQELAEARRTGWRAFLVLPTGAAPPESAVRCPASDQVSCSQCLLCGGDARANGRDVFIHVHGAAHIQKNFNRRVSCQETDSTTLSRKSASCSKPRTPSRDAHESSNSALRSTAEATGRQASPGLKSSTACSAT